jgi:hypothetical protein
VSRQVEVSVTETVTIVILTDVLKVHDGVSSLSGGAVRNLDMLKDINDILDKALLIKKAVKGNHSPTGKVDVSKIIFHLSYSYDREKVTYAGAGPLSI